MCVMRLAVASMILLVLGASSAHAINVKKRINAPGHPPKVWEVAGEFCSIKDWHPAIADCKETEEGGATFRILTLKDNGGTIKEKLVDKDDVEMSYSYEIVEGPLPVKNYQAKFWVEEDEKSPDRSTIFWEADFDANGVSDDEAAKVIRDIFMAGLKGIKQKMLPPEGGGNGDSEPE
jgi:polyketide cyclase/dehydrase/lipid transport protein